MNARFAFGGGFGLRYKTRRRYAARRILRDRVGFWHTHIILSRQTLFLIAAALLAFGGSLAGSFHYDDYSLFSGNLWRPLEIRPLTYFTFWLNYKLGGENPAGYHAVNLALHLIAVVLARAALGRLMPASAAFLAAAIFAVHPLQAEPVNYIFARSTLLETVFCLASLESWTRGRRSIAVAWFAAALLSKEECVSFPLFLFLLFWSISRNPRELKPIGAMLALAFAAGLRVLIAANTVAGSHLAAQSGVSWPGYLLTQGCVILRYLQLLAFPFGFTVDPDIAMNTGPTAYLAWAAALALVAVACLRLSRARAGFWFIGGLVLLLPSSSIFPAADLAADRRMYLPLVAFAACLGLLINAYWNRSALRAAAIIAFVALIALSFERTRVWRSEESLWTEAVRRAPAKLRPRIQLARALEPARALPILEQAKTIAPEDPVIASEEGRRYLEMGNAQQALIEFGRALALDPQNPQAINNRGAALLALGQPEAARADFERALTADPCQFDARLNLLRTGVTKPIPQSCRFTTAQQAALEGK